MEHVSGKTVRTWLESMPPPNQRCAVWAMYSKALREIYATGHLHGDPHTSNIIIFHDEYDSYQFFRLSWDETKNLWGIKLADTGSS